VPSVGVAPAETKPLEPPWSSLPQLLAQGARVIVATHGDAALGRAGCGDFEALGEALSEALRQDVMMPDEPVGEAADLVSQELRDGQICLLPDLSKYPGETSNDESFALGLARLADGYVGDALGSLGETWASSVRLPGLVRDTALGSDAAHGLGIIAQVLGTQRRNRLLVLGSSSFTENAETLRNLGPNVGRVCVTGALAATLLGAAGKSFAGVTLNTDHLPQARSLLAYLREQGAELVLPTDFRSESAESTPELGPASLAELERQLGQARAVVWCGNGSVNTPEAARVLSTIPTLQSKSIPILVLGRDQDFSVRELQNHAAVGLACSTEPDVAQSLLGARRLPGLDALRAAITRQRSLRGS
jgi:3-phosphoglycerate kinase